MYTNRLIKGRPHTLQRPTKGDIKITHKYNNSRQAHILYAWLCHRDIYCALYGTL